PGAADRTRAARDRPELGRARVQGGARRARLGRDAERAIDPGGDNRTAHGDRAGRARGERDAARPPAGRVTAAALRDILGTARTIAVVGLSPRPTRPSHAVARYLQGAGYRIVPVNPGHATILGEQSYPTLTAAAADQAIDVVDVFRRSKYVGTIVDEAIGVDPPPRLIWLQVGVVDDAPRAPAQAAGLPCVMASRLTADHRAQGVDGRGAAAVVPVGEAVRPHRAGAGAAAGLQGLRRAPPRVRWPERCGAAVRRVRTGMRSRHRGAARARRPAGDGLPRRCEGRYTTARTGARAGRPGPAVLQRKRSGRSRTGGGGVAATRMMSIIGRKNAGKTTLLVALAAELVRRKFRVMTIKHGTHPADTDQRGKDSWRHWHEGHAERVLMEGPGQRVLWERTEHESDPVALTRRYLAGAEIVLDERFKRAPLPKIEVYRL